jgi:hypothetical protein
MQFTEVHAVSVVNFARHHLQTVRNAAKILAPNHATFGTVRGSSVRSTTMGFPQPLEPMQLYATLRSLAGASLDHIALQRSSDCVQRQIVCCSGNVRRNVCDDSLKSTHRRRFPRILRVHCFLLLFLSIQVLQLHS